MLTIQDDSTWIERLVTANYDPWNRMSICKSTSRMAGRHLLLRVVHTYEFFLSLLQIDFRYAYPPRIDFRFDDSSTAFDDSQRFGCIGQPSNVFIHE